MSKERPAVKGRLPEEFKQQISDKLGFPMPESGWFELSTDGNGRVERARYFESEPIVININEIPQNVDELIEFHKTVLKIPLPTDNGRALDTHELETYRQKLCALYVDEFNKTRKINMPKR